MRCKNLYWILVLAGLVPAGCVSLGPQPDLSKFFALTSLPRSGQEAHSSAESSTLSVGIGPIAIPGYLDRE